MEATGARQQIRVVATYGDGRARDVTREAFVTSGNTDVATADTRGMMTAVRRGEAPILARYQGCYAATTLTVMGDRTGFVWEDPPAYNRSRRTGGGQVEASEAPALATLHRCGVYPPGVPRPDRPATHRRGDADVPRRSPRDPCQAGSPGRQLIGSPDFVDYWTNKWADLLDVNRKFLGAEGAAAYRSGSIEQVAQNRPYDHFVRSIVTASGSNRENPPASYYKILRTPDRGHGSHDPAVPGHSLQLQQVPRPPVRTVDTGPVLRDRRIFSRRSDCSPIRRARTARSADRPSRALSRSTKSWPTRDQGEINHERTGQVTAPEFPYPCQFPRRPDASRRQAVRRLADFGRQSVFCPQLRQPHLGIPDGRRHHPADRRHPRRESAQQSRAARFPDQANSSQAGSMRDM